MDVNYQIILAYIIGIIFLFFIGRLLLFPIKIVLRLVFNGLLGGVVLIIINFIGNIFGFAIPLNIFSALITGFLGIPGILLLIMLRSIFLY